MDGREIMHHLEECSKAAICPNSRLPSRSSSSPDDSMVMFKAASFCFSLFLALLLLLHPAESLGQSSSSSSKGISSGSKLELIGRILALRQFFWPKKSEFQIVHDFSSSSGKLFFLRICTGTDGRGSPFLYGSDRRASAARLTVGVEKQACATELCGGASVNTIRTFPRHIWRKRKAVGRSSIDSTGRQVAQFQGVFTPARPIFTGTKWRGLSRERDTPF